jgi:1-pyrroline-5-carboxylate dehydrogenase
MDAITRVPTPVNEPQMTYGPGSPERTELIAAFDAIEADAVELDACIGGSWRPGGGEEIQVVQPHERERVLGVLRDATRSDAADAVAAAQAAAPAWRELSLDDRCAILLKAADLLAGPWRQRLNAATMLGQSKTAVQAEVDSACELVDFWRFNVHYARQIAEEQPIANSPGVWNRTDHRPLDGFVYAITPFNFTAIAGNLPTAPALMGNTVVWKPSTTQQVAASLTMRILEEAGLPPGVNNMVPGHGPSTSDVVLDSPDLAGIHFTGSTAVFRRLWSTVGANLDRYRCYPRLVGETGGKDFVLAHPSADRAVVVTALVRGAFEYQGQKCSAASRAYLPRTIWNAVRDELIATTEGLPMGNPKDFTNFIGAVIDDRAFARLERAIERARSTPGLEIVAGGTCDDTVGWFVRPTIVVGQDPTDEVFTTEYFGPFLAIHVYEDSDFERVALQLESASSYALTGAIIARDRSAIAWASRALRFAAGNFYINDKPTGAVVGQQPFGGGRASGTNDKAGSALNLLRWTSPRSIKETFVSPTDHTYPHMAG